MEATTMGRDDRAPEATKRPSSSAMTDLSPSSPKRAKTENTPAPHSAPDLLPDAALLYQFAHSSWQAAHRHLAQVFFPPHLQVDTANTSTNLTIPDPLKPSTSQVYTHDPQAQEKSLNLLLTALDACQIGLNLVNVPDIEKVAFGALFGKIGLQVLLCHTQARKVKGKAKELEIPALEIDHDRLLAQMHEHITQCMAIARRSAFLVLMCHQLEILNIRLLLHEKKLGTAKRLVKQASEEAREHPAHVYCLQLLLLDHDGALEPSGALAAVDDLLTFARRHNHHQMKQVMLLVRIRLLFGQRRWDLLSSTLADLGSLIGWTNETGFSWSLSKSPESEYTATIAIHFLLYYSLWANRSGQTAFTRSLRKLAFGLMDEASETKSFSRLRANGAILEVPVVHEGYRSHILVQTTPPNILYAMTYLVALVSSRDITGSKAKVKSLIFAAAMRDGENSARADDMWDAKFSPHHTVLHARVLQQRVKLILAEVMLEQALAMMYRSSFAEADRVMADAISHIRDSSNFSLLAPHLSLLFAQRVHLLGQTEAASRYYHAGLACLVPGSDLWLALQLGLLGSSGALAGLASGSAEVNDTRRIVELAKASSNTALVGVGMFLSSLLDNGAAAKTKLRSAWDVAHRTSNKLLLVLLYAFLASTDLSGDFDRVSQQLLTGLTLTSALGGTDREDGVGQGPLGLWYASRLIKLYKSCGHAGLEDMRQVAGRHAAYNKTLLEYAQGDLVT